MVGNAPNFAKIDILRCFLRINKNIGRKEIARELELGEGTVRTILESLKSKGFLASTKKGHFLSGKGSDALKTLHKSMSSPKSLNVHAIYPNFKKIGILVRKVSGLKELYKLRDVAVKNGADGAIILRFQDKLYAPDSDFQQDYDDLSKYFNFETGDVLIIGFSSRNRLAEIGAIAIAVEICESLQNFMSLF